MKLLKSSKRGKKVKSQELRRRVNVGLNRKVSELVGFGRYKQRGALGCGGPEVAPSTRKWRAVFTRDELRQPTPG